MSDAEKQATTKVKASLRAKERAKRQYDKADALLSEAIAVVPVGFAVPLKDGRKAVIIDNYAGKNVAWGHASVRRYEVKVTK